MKKCQKKCRFGSGKWFFGSHHKLHSLRAVASKKAQQLCAPAEKSVINMI
jgi:hypothetical protein